MPQEAFGRHHHQRFSELAAHLTSQAVKDLSRRREIANLHVVASAKLQEAFKPGARMLGTLALIPMRKKHHEPAHALPLALGARDELVDDDLRAVGEIAELRFPDGQSLRVSQ